MLLPFLLGHVLVLDIGLTKMWFLPGVVQINAYVVFSFFTSIKLEKKQYMTEGKVKGL